MRVFLSVRLLSNFSRARHCSGSFPRTSDVDARSSTRKREAAIRRTNTSVVAEADDLVAAPALDAIVHFFTYLCRRARAQKSSADRRTDTATPLVGLSSFRPLVFAWLSLHSRLSIPFQRLGMLRRVDGLAEEQCGDSLPPVKDLVHRECAE